MKNKIIIILLSVFLNSCGFQSLYKDFNLTDLNIKKINYVGKNELNYLVKNFLNLNETNNAKGITINFTTSESLISTNKNASGITIEEQLTISISISINDADNINLLEDTFTQSKKLVVTNNLNTDEEKRRIEKSNLIKNLAQKIKFKIQLAIKNK